MPFWTGSNGSWSCDLILPTRSHTQNSPATSLAVSQLADGLSLPAIIDCEVLVNLTISQKRLDQDSEAASIVIRPERMLCEPPFLLGGRGGFRLNGRSRNPFRQSVLDRRCRGPSETIPGTSRVGASAPPGRVLPSQSRRNAPRPWPEPLLMAEDCLYPRMESGRGFPGIRCQPSFAGNRDHFG